MPSSEKRDAIRAMAENEVERRLNQMGPSIDRDHLEQPRPKFGRLPSIAENDLITMYIEILEDAKCTDLDNVALDNFNKACKLIGAVSQVNGGTHWRPFITLLEHTGLMNNSELSAIKHSTLGLTENGLLVAMPKMKTGFAKHHKRFLANPEGTRDVVNDIRNHPDIEKGYYQAKWDASTSLVVKLAAAVCAKNKDDRVLFLQHIQKLAYTCLTVNGMKEVFNALGKRVEHEDIDEIIKLHGDGDATSQLELMVNAQLRAAGFDPDEDLERDVYTYIKYVTAGLIRDADMKADFKLIALLHRNDMYDDTNRLKGFVSSKDKNLANVSEQSINALRLVRGNNLKVIRSFLVHAGPFLQNEAVKQSCLTIFKLRCKRKALEVESQIKKNTAEGRRYLAEVKQINEYILEQANRAGFSNDEEKKALLKVGALTAVTTNLKKSRQQTSFDAKVAENKSTSLLDGMTLPDTTDVNEAVNEASAPARDSDFSYPFGKKTLKGKSSSKTTNPFGTGLKS